MLECPKPIIGSFEIGAKTFADIREICKFAVSNENYDLYELTPYSNRVKDVTGGMAVDTGTRTVYVYAEFKSNGSVGSASDYRLLLNTPVGTSAFLPKVSTAAISCLMTDSESDAYRNFGVCIYSSNTYISLALNYGQIMSDNQKFIIYGFWQY